MRPDLSQLLDEALERLRAGATIEECLRAYPEHATELEPMLRTAAAIQRQAVAALPPSLEQWLASGRREIEAIARTTYTRPETHTQRTLRHVRNMGATMLRRGGPRMASAVLSALIIFLMTFYTVDAAAARSLPGDYLYSWKLFSEQARITMASDPDRRAQLATASVERRVAEIAALAERDQDSTALISETVERLEAQVSQAIDALPATSPDTHERTAIRLGRLLVRAESDLRGASAPDQSSSEVIETAAASVAGMLSDLPVEAPADAAAIVPLPDATPEAAQGSQGAPQSGPQPGAPSSSQAGGVISSPITAPTEIQGAPSDDGGVSAPEAPGAVDAPPTSQIPATPTLAESASPTTTRTRIPTRTPNPVGGTPTTTTPEPSATSRPGLGATPSPEPASPTPTLEVIVQPTLPPTDTVTPTASASITPTETATRTPAPTATETDTPEPTATRTATATAAPTATETDTPTATRTATATATPTATETATPTTTATPTETRTPAPTPTTIGDDPEVIGLRPLLECVAAQDGRYIAYFGYRNNTPGAETVLVGPENRFLNGPEDLGQPTEFPAGRSKPYPEVFFSVTFDGPSLSWSLGGHTVTAEPTSRPCPVVTPTPSP